jgi:hypothetical protein
MILFLSGVSSSKALLKTVDWSDNERKQNSSTE